MKSNLSDPLGQNSISVPWKHLELMTLQRREMVLGHLPFAFPVRAWDSVRGRRKQAEGHWLLETGTKRGSQCERKTIKRLTADCGWYSWPTGKPCPGPAPAVNHVCPVHSTQLFGLLTFSWEARNISQWRNNTQEALKTIIIVSLKIRPSKSVHQIAIPCVYFLYSSH